MLFFALVIITLSTIVFCYGSVLKAIRDVKEDNSTITSESQLTNIEKKTFKKVLTYILIFILQYVPILVYNIFRFLKVKKYFFLKKNE